MKVFALLLALALLLTSANAFDSRVYQVELAYDSGTLSMESLNVTFGYTEHAEGDYRLELINSLGMSIYNASFGFPLTGSISRSRECYDANGHYNRTRCPHEQTYIERSEASVLLNIPYASNGQEIVIYGPDGKKELTVFVAQFSDYCGDMVCSPGEKYSCSQDCGTEYIDVLTKESNWRTYLIAGLILVLIGLVVLLIVHNRKKEPPQQTDTWNRY